jgi:hypothetical protein
MNLTDLLLVISQIIASGGISISAVVGALTGVKGTTFGSIIQASPLTGIAAVHKDRKIYKVTKQSLTLAGNIDASLYVNAVQRTAALIDANDTDAVASFELSRDSYYVPVQDDVRSAVALKSAPHNHYIEGLSNGASEVEYVDYDNRVLLTREQAAAFCTPSAARKMLDTNPVELNQANDVLHLAKPRAFKVKNIHTLKVNKVTVSVV